MTSPSFFHPNDPRLQPPHLNLHGPTDVESTVHHQSIFLFATSARLWTAQPPLPEVVHKMAGAHPRETKTLSQPKAAVAAAAIGIRSAQIATPTIAVPPPILIRKGICRLQKTLTHTTRNHIFRIGPWKSASLGTTRAAVSTRTRPTCAILLRNPMNPS
jgi:hypothetical protein